jgi:hypothetical protein
MKKQILCSILLAVLLFNVLATSALSQQKIGFGKTQPLQQANPQVQGTPLAGSGNTRPQGFSIGDIFDDIVDTFKDLVEVPISLFEGGNILAGLALVGSQLIIPLPQLQGKAIELFIVGTVAGKLLIKQRHMNAQERAFAEKIFGNTLPANDKIFITNLTGVGGREFVIPNGLGQILVNMGDGYHNPMGYTRGSYTVPGQVFIHELTHVWQIHHSKFIPGLVCEGVSNQIRDTLGEEIYNPGTGERNWSDYTLEQQGALVDRWYANGQPEDHPFYHFIASNIRGEQFPRRMAAARNGAVSRISTSMETFWIERNGSVQAAYVYDGSLWKGFELAPAGSAAVGGGLASVSRFPGHMEVFWIGANGSIQSAYWYLNWDKSRRIYVAKPGVWTRYELAPAGSAALTGGITVVSRNPSTMEVFWIGQNGSVEDAYYYDTLKGWKRFQLAPGGSASTTGNITSLARQPGTMEIFWIGVNGSIQDAYFYDGQKGWTRQEIMPAGSASVTGNLTALTRSPNTLEIFWIGANGSVQDAHFYDGQKGWNHFELAPAGSASLTGGITALSREASHLETFWVGAKGSLEGAFFYNGGRWTRYQLAPDWKASLKATISAVCRTPNTLEIFWDDETGSIHDAYWYAGATWKQFLLKDTGLAGRVVKEKVTEATTSERLVNKPIVRKSESLKKEAGTIQRSTKN